MAKLKGKIPLQNFEVIRDRIGEILAQEFAHQHDTYAGINPTIWIERATPFDDTELPAINICLDQGDYDRKTIRKVDGQYVYNIDCYASAATSATVRADKLASIDLHRLIGMSRAILEHPGYSTLDYAPPFNCSVAISGFKIGGTSNNQDAGSTQVGRITYSVSVPESIELQKAITLTTSTTIVNLALTDKGYRYEDFFGERRRLVTQQGQGLTSIQEEQITQNL